MIHVVSSPLGPISLAVDRQGALVYLGFQDHEPRLERLAGVLRAPDLTEDPAKVAPIRIQLAEYFHDGRTRFEVPLAPRGTPFQLRVWGELLRIPYGSTLSYGELARRMGDPQLARAVGTANGANPISILIPCHRVIGKNGSLTGYAGGLDMKRALLDLEQGVRASGLKLI